jgi:hypothetical protein
MTQHPPHGMTKGEREDLQRLIRQREKVLKSAAKQRSSELIADFENQMGSAYSFDDDEVWDAAVKAVQPLVDQAKQRMAQTQVEAIERKAITEIEMSCLHAQEQIAIAGLTSDAAKKFFERLPSVEGLMPRLSLAEIAGEADPPLAEQLVSSNALRQRRYRERQAEFRRNATEALRDASRNTDDGTQPWIPPSS